MSSLLDAFAHFRLLDLLDITVVALIFYWLITLVRGTRAVQLMIGVGLVLAVYAVAGYLDLRALRWLLDKALTIALFAIPVIFQPELRRALEALGRGPQRVRQLFAETAPIERAIEAVNGAAQPLSKRRIGALIVFEREVGLQELTETGIALEAIPSRELLINIFIPNTPLHDGAVIIDRQGRMMAAACFLPLTGSRDVDPELGTRHRAALGVSEETDAVAVVVSEETGQVSVAVGGRLSRGLDEGTFVSYLRALLMPQAPSRGWWRRLWASLWDWLRRGGRSAQQEHPSGSEASREGKQRGGKQ
ncbi:MAG: TIGR00159 family protein [Firmicutes bacterium]|nr:TIGR00159 family protein [Bacillota bacterium]